MILKSGRLFLCLAAMATAPAVTEAQMFFEADFVTLKLDDGGSSSFITGPDAFGGTSKTDYEPGYRIVLGGAVGNYEVYGMVTQTDQWRDSGQITLASPLVLDDNAASPFVAPANVLAYTNSLFDAATVSNVDPTLDETSEIELIQAGAIARTRSQVDYRDFEISGGTNRNNNPWRFAVGYRHIRLDGNSDFAVSGTFDALDVNDGNPLDDPNDGLAEESFLDAGYTVGSGGGGFDGASTPDGPDTMTVLNSFLAHNELHGAQATFGYRLFDGEMASLEAIGKAGLYYNRLNGSVSETVAGSGNASALYQRSFTDSKATSAFVGTLGVRGTIALTDYISLIAGYEAQFLNGVAVTGDQPFGLGRDLLGNVAYSAAIGNTIIHGANVGLELLW